MMAAQLVMKRIKTGNRSVVKRQTVRGDGSNDQMETIGDRVRALREASKGKSGRPLSRQDLADAVGMKKTTLQTLEDKPQETSRYLPALADYFGVRASWLATGKGQKYPSRPPHETLGREFFLEEPSPDSQTVRPDPEILVEAGETLDLLETTEGRPSLLPADQLAAWLRKLADMYGTVVDAGGTIPARQLAEMMRAALVRRENSRGKGGKDSSNGELGH